jgi:hypothetical protein
MGDADVVSLYWNPMLDLCAGLVRERVEEQNRSMELMTERIERLRQRTEGLMQAAQTLSRRFDAAIELTVSTVELAITRDPADPEALPDPIHEMTAVGCAPMEGETHHPEAHLDYPAIVQPRRPDRTTPGDRIP